MSNCILCGRKLSEEEVELGFDICEYCEEDDSTIGGFAGGSVQTKMRTSKDSFNKTAHRPRGADKFDGVDTRDYIGDYND